MNAVKPIKIIRDPDTFRLLGDETRRKIVFLLRVKERTVSQIAAELNITPQAVYHHIKRLHEGGLVEVSREERVDHIIESYYRTTAESFICTYGSTPSSKEVAVEQITTVLNALKKLGFNVEFNDNTISQLIDLQRTMKYCCSTDKYADAIANLDNVDFLTQHVVQEYVELLSMSDDEFNEQHEYRKKFRSLLLSLLKK